MPMSEKEAATNRETVEQVSNMIDDIFAAKKPTLDDYGFLKIQLAIIIATILAFLFFIIVELIFAIN